VSDALSAGQITVLRAFHEFGPMDDTALAVYVHHVAEQPMSSSGIRTRRAELVRKGLLAVVRTKRVKSGRRAAIHGLTWDGRAVTEVLFQEKESVV
jgi:hypothetical protein